MVNDTTNVSNNGVGSGGGDKLTASDRLDGSVMMDEPDELRDQAKAVNTADQPSSLDNTAAKRQKVGRDDKKGMQKNNFDELLLVDEKTASLEKKEDIRSNVQTKEQYNQVQSMVLQQSDKLVDELVKTGLAAFYRTEAMEREQAQLRQSIKSKETELERLKITEKESQASIANLLRAIEASKVQARKVARVALSEAALRADLHAMTKQRDEALEKAEESKRQSFLLDEQLGSVKAKLSRISQEKLKMERDQRATMTFAKSLDNSVAIDVEYYKRKVQESNGHVQGLQAMLVEKNRQIEDMRRQIERSMSHNRLSQLRAGTPDSHKII